MNRHDWKFQFTASKLAEGAKNKLKSHKVKLEYWENKKKEVLEKIAQTGVKVTDSLAADYGSTKGFVTPSVSIDPELQKHLTEAHSKIQVHHSKMAEYSAWVQVFEGNPESRLDLDQEDYMFFFGE